MGGDPHTRSIGNSHQTFRWFLVVFLSACGGTILPPSVPAAGPEIFLREEPGKYLVIDKLAGLGMLPGLMTGDRGLEIREVALEASRGEPAEDPFVEGMLRLLREDAARSTDFRVRLGAECSEDGFAPPNAQGLSGPEGCGLRAGGFFRSAPADMLGLQARGDLLLDSAGDAKGNIEESSLRVGFPRGTLEAGAFSLWWGPGRHGALIFTTNAPPLAGIRIRNPQPVRFGWPARFLGMFQYDLFLARLEDGRPVPRTLLSGVRVAFRPNRYLEIGFSRAFHYGGEGRENGLSAWWEGFKGRGTNDPGSNVNQLGGGDISVVLPFAAQPVQLYLEMAGEDQTSGPSVSFPYKWAYLAGVFFPSILGSPRWDFRVEAALNHVGGSGPSWYVNSQPEYAHIYKDRILGHHMGTDAQDVFLEAHYFLLPSSFMEINLDVTQRHFPGGARESSTRITGAFVGWLTRNVRAAGRIGFARSSDVGGVAGDDSGDSTAQVELAWQFR